ncbi:MFS transporter [Kurthia sp. Dielmo]|uniref:MFS transporter n=1 Tax=Kurthia sp. Dielmo TaxID=1033738 RepID=UPI00112160B9|nr:MFS transporter [Kurthia sp. Dielmo]
MSSQKKSFHYAWIILIGISLILGLAKGAITNGSSLFLTPVSTELGIGMGNLTLYLSIGAIMTLVVLPFAGKLFEKYDVRLLLTIAIILQGGSFAAFGLMNSVWGWYIIAVPMAFGTVPITLLAGPILIARWFKTRGGLALGIMGAVAGLLNVFIQLVVGNMIEWIGWRSTYISVGLGIIVLTVPVALFLLRSRPQDKNLQPLGAEQQDGQAADDSIVGMAFDYAKKTKAFLLLASFFFIITAVASFAVHIPTYLAKNGYEVAFAGTAMSMVAVGSLLGALTFGILIDRIGAKTTALGAMVMGIIAILLFMLFPTTTPLILVGGVFFGFISASITTLAPALTTALFGTRDYSRIYSSVSVGLAVASIVALPGYGYVLDFTGSYTPAMIAVIVLLVMNMLFVVLAFRDKDVLVKQGTWDCPAPVEPLKETIQTELN